MSPHLVLPLLEAVARHRYLFRSDPGPDRWEVVERRGGGVAQLGYFAEWDHADRFTEALTHRCVARALRRLKSPEG